MLHRLLNALILLPDRYGYQVPADLGLQAEPVTLPNAQGQRLRGFRFQPLVAQAAAPVVIFCPGTSGNLSSHLAYVELLCRAGCTVLSVDYTGFGRSDGVASLHTLVTDVLSVCDFLHREQQVESFGIFGMSLGANLALLAATQRPQVRAVAVEGLALYDAITHGVLAHGVMGPRDVTTITYEDGPPLARRHHVLNRRRMPGWLATALARAGMRWFPFAGKDPRVPARLLTETPVLCIHGVDDPLLPFEGTVQVYEALPGPKQLWLIPEVGHPQEAALAQDGEYVAQLARFFTATLGGSEPLNAASLTAQLVPHGPSEAVVCLRNAGPPGMVLLTIRLGSTLMCRTVWVQQTAQVPIHTGGQPAQVYYQRLYAVNGEGAAAQPLVTSRGQHYRTTLRPLLRAISQGLHERRFADLEPLLQTLPHTRPEAPFDFFLGLYCVQIMQRSQRTAPRVAQMAAAIFQRYWHYGPDTVPPGQPTLEALAAAILAQAAIPHRMASVGQAACHK